MVTFPDLLKEHHIDTREPGSHHHVTTEYVGFDCPFCSPRSGRFRMGYHLGKGFVTCWSCGYHPLGDTLALLLDIPRGRAWHLLGGIERPRFTQKSKATGALKNPPGLGPLLAPHKSFLKRRRIDPDVASGLWGVQGLGVAGRLSWRLFLPIHHEGVQVSWTTRSLVNEGIRYVTAKVSESTVNPKGVLFGEDFARQAIVICEGPLDVLRVGPGAVATLGLKVSRAQVERMSRFPVRAIVFDSESLAQRVARKLVRDLEVFPGSTYLVELDTGKDPGEASDWEVRELRKRFLE